MNNIQFTSDISSAIREIIAAKKYTYKAVLVDENTIEHCLPLLNLEYDLLIKIRSGEENKNINTCEDIWQQLTEAQFDRNSLLINLGGGVIGDMGGFCAATYKRGIDFINIPTTLLAQVDASIGGKLGIDFNGLKNHIGLFQDPKMVLIDTIFLNTLPTNQLRSGFAEVIKHHLIADLHGWSKLIHRNWNDQNWLELVKHSVRIKEQIVEDDPKESGRRKVLNFGHTIGHAVESFYLNTNKRLLHGEAIAIGMICEAYLSKKKGHITSAQLNEIKNVIKTIFDSQRVNELQEITALVSQDKKNKGGEVLSVLLDGIGKATWDNQLLEEEIIESIDYFNQT